MFPSALLEGSLHKGHRLLITQCSISSSIGYIEDIDPTYGKISINICRMNEWRGEDGAENRGGHHSPLSLVSLLDYCSSFIS